MILHIPNSSRVIPEKLMGQIVLPSEELAVEIIPMTDAYTNELFALPGIAMVEMQVVK